MSDTSGHCRRQPRDGRTLAGRPIEEARWSCDGVPDLDDPVLVAAFEGWNDAGEAATGGRRAPGGKWQADPARRASTRRITTTSRSTGRSCPSTRPASASLDWPTTRVSLRPTGCRARPRRRPGARASSPTCAGAASAPSCSGSHELGVERVVTARRSACRRPAHPAGTGDGFDQRSSRWPQSLGLEPSRYEGPTGHRRRVAGRRTAATAWSRYPCGQRCRTTSAQSAVSQGHVGAPAPDRGPTRPPRAPR